MVEIHVQDQIDQGLGQKFNARGHIELFKLQNCYMLKFGLIELEISNQIVMTKGTLFWV